ncbi:MAG: D-aminoacyl-tRNA deacylase [Firmicutes bacterium]|nr:D-aminoacyl-tRNA deacylase [Bacillota bacterium]
MRVVLQRVSHAKVMVDDQITGQIGVGLLVFLGVGKEDNSTIVEQMVDKIHKLRIFADQDGKTNLSSSEVQAQILVVSQFTLCADCSKNRPSFSAAADAKFAQDLYEYFVQCCKSKFARVETGRFGADMSVHLCNDGPFTLVL